MSQTNDSMRYGLRKFFGCQNEQITIRVIDVCALFSIFEITGLINFT
jgi:hypothetical protein